MGQSSAVAPVLEPSDTYRAGGVAGYAVTIFLSAFLLFQVQLIMGKSLLPWFGGVPAVWNTCMLVYQVLLLGGYAYAHAVSMRLGVRAQARLHVALLGFSALVMAVLGLLWRTPLTPGSEWKPEAGGDPVWQIMLLLGATIALPFFLLSTTGPLLQAWFSRTHPGRSPYRLYALSNVGSLLGLLSYPMLVERHLRLPQQAWMWAAGYALFVLACGATAWLLMKRTPAIAAQALPASDSPAPSLGRRILWLALAACASAMLLGTTNLICQQLAVIPFLWVVPLCLYLLTFIVCFDRESWYRRGIFHPLYLVSLLAVLYALRLGPDGVLLHELVGCSLALWASCMVCHGELVRIKPAARHLTSFYLTVAAGGALGGVFVVLLAPRLFTGYWEFHIALFATGALLLVALAVDKGSWLHFTPAPPRVVLAVLAVALAGLGYVGYRPQAAWYGGFINQRNFFGVKSVMEDRDGRWFRHGATAHGVQLRDARLRREPTLYYKTRSGVGLLMLSHPQPPGMRRVGVVGLGIGTLAAYGRAGDYYRFYEIDPQVTAVSLGLEPYFTFLRDSQAKWDVVMGDARLSLERELERGEPQKFDILVLDAFSSDAIPAHLLTQEAFEVYLQHLKGPDSVLAFNISNRHVDLSRLLLRTAQEQGLAFVLIPQPPFSRWVLMSANPERVKVLESERRAVAVPYDPTLRIWTDDFSNLLDVIRYR